MATARVYVLVTTVLALGLVGASGCSGGPATGIPLPTGKQEPAGGGPEPTGGGQDPSGGGVEPGGGTAAGPSSSGGSTGGGSSSGSSTGGGTSCLSCGTYTCTVSVNGQSATTPVTLVQNADGTCFDGEAGGTLACNGNIVSGNSGSGKKLGTWQATSGGGFTATVSGATVTCTPG